MPLRNFKIGDEIRDENGALICRVARVPEFNERVLPNQFKDWTIKPPKPGGPMHPAVSRFIEKAAHDRTESLEARWQCAEKRLTSDMDKLALPYGRDGAWRRLTALLERLSPHKD